MAKVEEGVQFPLHNGERSSLAFGQQVFADAVRHYDPNLATRIEASTNWRSDYVEYANELTVAGIRSGDTAVGIARNGLASIHDNLVFARGENEYTLREAIDLEVEPTLEAVQIIGDGEQTTTMDVRYGGKALMGEAIQSQLDAWVEKGVAEEGFRDAISAVVGNPEWYDLRDTTIVLLGAGAEMSPVRQLLSWGATVIAVDLPGSARWKKLIADARVRSGRLIVPATLGRLDSSPADNETAGASGADIVLRMPEVRRWLRDTMPDEAAIASLAYADGATHVKVSAASDAIIAGLQADGKCPMLSFLATPTDAWAVPADVVAASQQRWDERGALGTAQLPLRVTAGMFTPNYTRTWPSERRLHMGVCDAVVPQQGANYLLAKRMQHWRALVARDEANTVSFNIMAATRTNSVVKNRLLSAAYAGANRFGIEVFSPDTSRTLAAALLVHDLRNPKAASKPSVRLNHPYVQHQRTANHGGLWRMAYSPRSVLSIAAVLGLFKSGS